MTFPTDTRRLELHFKNGKSEVFDVTSFEETKRDIRFIAYDETYDRYDTCAYLLVSLIGWNLEVTRHDTTGVASADEVKFKPIFYNEDKFNPYASSPEDVFTKVKPATPKFDWTSRNNRFDWTGPDYHIRSAVDKLREALDQEAIEKELRKNNKK